MANARLAVLYEHPEWFKPLFAELDRRSIAFVPLYAGEFCMTRQHARFLTL